MLLYYIRHGYPIYNPDSLTPLGERQAEAVAKRLAMHGIDRVYSSTSNRAIQTAMPTCEILGKELTQLDFANENYTWNELTVIRNGVRRWLYQDGESRMLLNDKSVRDLGFEWYSHPEFAEYDFKKGMNRIYDETDKFLASFGYEHERYTGTYRITEPNNEKIALFAHEGFNMAFMSCLLDIPYPKFATHFAINHTGMTVIEFTDEGNGYSIAQVLTYSSDSHLYKEGLPTKYHNRLYI